MNMINNLLCVVMVLLTSFRNIILTFLFNLIKDKSILILNFSLCVAMLAVPRGLKVVIIGDMKVVFGGLKVVFGGLKVVFGGLKVVREGLKVVLWKSGFTEEQRKEKPEFWNLEWSLPTVRGDKGSQKQPENWRRKHRDSSHGCDFG
jgi:hypothetical protein